MGAFFTATSMIGFIAGAGIVVRNSIILVDFIELRLREGMPLAEAVVDAGAVRFRPMALTAAAVIVGSAVILFDPIFQWVWRGGGGLPGGVFLAHSPPVLRVGADSHRPQEHCHESGLVRSHACMTIERGLRLIAGAFVALSVLLGIYVDSRFLWFTLFVGLNLFQSAFTDWCPMMAILRKGGLTRG